METNNIYLCGNTALRFWQYLRGAWSPRLDQLCPLPQELRKLGFEPMRTTHLEVGDCGEKWAIETVRGQLAEFAACLSSGLYRSRSMLGRLALGERSLKGLPEAVMNGGPLELLIPDGVSRRRSARLVSRFWRRPLPARSFIELGGGVHVALPEFALLQLEEGKSDVALALWMFEMRGAYTTGCIAGTSTVRCLPLTDGVRMERFVKGIAGERGSARLKRAACLSADNSASVMESAMVMLLTFPRHRGGYGLPMPEMNRRIDVPQPLREVARKSWVACDALWRDARVALEYDGRLDHAGTSNVRRDYERSSVLNMLGVQQISVTSEVLFDAEQFNRLARQVAGLIGHRLYARDFDTGWFEARRKLRAEMRGAMFETG